MNVDFLITITFVLLVTIGGRREGRRPRWARRVDVIVIPSLVLLVVVGWVATALHGTDGAWVTRLAYLPMIVMAVTSWMREK